MEYISCAQLLNNLSWPFRYRPTNHPPHEPLCLNPLLLWWPDSSDYLTKKKGAYTLTVCTDFAQTLFDTCSGITRTSFCHSVD